MKQSAQQHCNWVQTILKWFCQDSGQYLFLKDSCVRSPDVGEYLNMFHLNIGANNLMQCDAGLRLQHLNNLYVEKDLTGKDEINKCLFNEYNGIYRDFHTFFCEN